MTSELFLSVYKEKSDHLFDDRIFSCPVPAFTLWSIFVPLSENPCKYWGFSFFYRLLSSRKIRHFPTGYCALKTVWALPTWVRVLPPLPKGLHKIDAPTENPDFIGVFAVFTVKKHKGRMTDENCLFCLNREI